MAQQNNKQNAKRAPKNALLIIVLSEFFGLLLLGYVLRLFIHAGTGEYNLVFVALAIIFFPFIFVVAREAMRFFNR